MALFLSGGAKGFDGPLAKDAVELHFVGRNGAFITSRTPQLAIDFTVAASLPGVSIGGTNLPDFPPTPAAPEPWILGCIQNVIRHTIKIIWLNGSTEVVEQLPSLPPMLDADPEVSAQPHLPFVRQQSSAGVPASMGFLYGLPGTPRGVPAVPPKGPGPAWDLNGAPPPFDVVDDDGPSLSVLNFKGGGASGSANPIVEVTRSLTLQKWVTAVPVLPLTNLSNASKHFILGYTNELTLTSSYDRRAGGRGQPSDAGNFNFSLGNFNGTPSQFNLNRNIGNSTPPRRRPVVSGQLSTEFIKTWMVQKGFGPV